MYFTFSLILVNGHEQHEIKTEPVSTNNNLDVSKIYQILKAKQEKLH